MTMIIEGYELMNGEKLRRVIEGTLSTDGSYKGGLGNDADPADILAQYDKQGGLIKGAEGATVKTGSFYDFKNKKPHAKPQVVYTFRVNGKEIDVPEGEPIPLVVKAAQAAATQEAEEEEEKPKKRRAKK